MTLSCIILDDEEIAIRHLMTYIAKIPHLQLQNYFTDPVEAIHYLESNPIDLVFLDVEMPNFSIDGLDFINIIGNKQQYIFTTAYPQYALPSYDYNTVDFLHKPISFERFSKAVQKAKHLHHIPPETTPDGVGEYIFVKTDTRLQQIIFEDICWVESERNYISIFTETDRVTVLMSISDFEAQMPKKLFARIHKSYIVPLKRVTVVEKDQVKVRRQNTLKSLPLGDSYKKHFIQTVEQLTFKRPQ